MQHDNSIVKTGIGPLDWIDGDLPSHGFPLHADRVRDKFIQIGKGASLDEFTTVRLGGRAHRRWVVVEHADGRKWRLTGWHSRCGGYSRCVVAVCE